MQRDFNKVRPAVEPCKKKKSFAALQQPNPSGFRNLKEKLAFMENLMLIDGF